jgi:hypothetical protein
MPSVTTDLRAPGAARPIALRAADGVIAGYIHSLAHAATRSPADSTKQKLGRRASQAYECGASRSSGLAGRRRRQLLRAPAAA